MDKAVGIVAKVAVEMLPAGGLLTEAWSVHREQVEAAVREESQRHLDQFYANMLAADSTINEQEARAMVDSKDFHALLRACLADIEGEKVSMYAELARAIATGRAQAQWRRHFVIALRDLSEEELQLLRTARVATEHRLIPRQGLYFRVRDLLGGGTPGSKRSVHLANLTAKSLIHDGQLTQLGGAFVKACFAAKDLTPAALGYKVWTGLHVTILNYELGTGRLDSVAHAIESALRAVGVSSQIFAPTHQIPLDGKRLRLAALLSSEASAGVAKEAKTLARMLHRVPTILVRFDAQAVVPAGVVFGHEIDAHGRDPKVVAADVASAVDATRVHGKA